MASSTDEENSIKQTTLKGHKESVLCLAHSSEIASSITTATPTTTTACLLSGSEDGTARLWDLRAPLRASICITVGGEVTSVAFAPKPTIRTSGDAHAASGPFARNVTMYLSVGSQVLGYDLRQCNSPIVTQPHQDLSQQLETTEEVNQVCFASARGSSTSMMATADDTGCVRVTDPSLSSPSDAQRRRKILHHDPDRLAMVTCCSFRPRSQDVLASAGTDCTVHLWNLHKAHKPQSTVQIPPDDTGPQICNPPMVHSLAWAPSGRWLGAGLGDGSIAIFAVHGDKRKKTTSTLQQQFRIRDGHEGSSVASVLFPDWTQSENIGYNDRWMASAGSDCNVFLWDLGNQVFNLEEEARNSNRRQMSNLESGLAALSLSSNEHGDGSSSSSSEPRILFGIPHQHKPNWMVSSRQADPIFPNTLFLADTTNNITAYTIPM